nr:hypothetical protein [Tanacetum cinerariifolium]
MACDVSWKSRLSKFNDENVLLKTQVDSVVQERENIKLEYQNLFNLIKETRAQHQQEVNELIENISQKTYAYSDVRFKNQYLFMVILSSRKNSKSLKNGKAVNTKIEKSVTSRKPLCVTPLSNNIVVQAKKVSNPKDNTDRGEGSFNSVKRPKSKDTKSKNRVLKNTNAKSSSLYVRKTPNIVRINSNKHETKNSNECQSNASVLNTKNVTAVNDGSNIVCVSCGKDVFMLSHKKCVARYAFFRDSRVKRDLFTTPIVVQSKNLGANSIVAKSTFSVAKTPTATNKADIGISIRYYESSRGFLIYSRQTKKIMETFHVELDELTAMASKCNNLKPRLNCSNFKDSSDDMNETPLQQDLDNLFGHLYKEYYALTTSEVSTNSAENTFDNEDTRSSSSIIVEDSAAL